MAVFRVFCSTIHTASSAIWCADEQGGWQDRSEHRPQCAGSSPPRRRPSGPACGPSSSFITWRSPRAAGSRRAPHPSRRRGTGGDPVRGQGTFILDGQPHAVGAEDVIHIAPGVGTNCETPRGHALLPLHQRPNWRVASAPGNGPGQDRSCRRLNNRQLERVAWAGGSLVSRQVMCIRA